MAALQLRDDCRTVADVRARARGTRDRHREMFQHSPVDLKPEPSPKPSLSPRILPQLQSFVEIVDICSHCGGFKLRKAYAFEESPLTTNWPTISSIIIATAKYFNLAVDQIISERRQRLFVEARFVAMYLASELTGKSLSTIALAMDRDHTTIMSGIRAVKRNFGVYADRIAAVKSIIME